MNVCRMNPPASERCLHLVRDPASSGDIASFMPMADTISNPLEADHLSRYVQAG
jgi:hypothetical protein